jgi:hypothetical protein
VTKRITRWRQQKKFMNLILIEGHLKREKQGSSQVFSMAVFMNQSTEPHLIG